MLEALLEGYELVIQRPVTWGSMDAFQHVNNTVYFRYFEDARLAYFATIKIEETMKRDGIGPILASTQCRFKAPLTYPDTVHIGTRVAQLQEDRFLMEYIVVSQTLQKVAALGKGMLVSYDYRNNCKATIPQAWRDLINVYQPPTE